MRASWCRCALRQAEQPKQGRRLDANSPTTSAAVSLMRYSRQASDALDPADRLAGCVTRVCSSRANKPGQLWLLQNAA